MNKPLHWILAASVIAAIGWMPPETGIARRPAGTVLQAAGGNPGITRAP